MLLNAGCARKKIVGWVVLSLFGILNPTYIYSLLCQLEL
ncbi:putative membrane protein [Lyngbya aestuarii BL J]|uniref:Putative membrane protein n=1 Tax=Lyngbya aestuarii BL J TaxID=1348334 RepID=U7QCV5_9CYAN|nr:putative membrane protein [Lyngbya aestuarii BL J]